MKLETTGERVIEDSYLLSPRRYLIYLFHLITYRFATDYVRDSAVLDYGCGSGYGSHLLAAHCRSITGVDISGEAIAYAASRYQAGNLDYRQIEPAEQAPLPFADASFDTVVSFQVIEHITDVEPYLREIDRVLKPGGSFICATPDRASRLLPGQKPWNVFHVREYSRAGFQKTLSRHFPEVQVLKMGGRPEVLAPELRRATTLKWLTLPVTLPFIPEVIRKSSLHALKRLSDTGQPGQALTPADMGFSEADLFIAADAQPSTNLVAVARKA